MFKNKSGSIEIQDLNLKFHPFKQLKLLRDNLEKKRKFREPVELTRNYNLSK